MSYDLIVIGGGAAGLMAAGRAGECGARVLLLEKNERVGVKLLLTGKERCNLTNNISVREMVKAFGSQGKFLFSALSRFDSASAIDFFTQRGVKIKIEDNNRAFPVSDKARDILAVLLDYIRQSQVEVITGAAVKKIVKEDNLIKKVVLADGREFFAKNYLIATGGKSYPATGSTGEGYNWLAALGHKVVEPRPALAPIIVKNKFIKDLEGVSLVGVKFSWQKDERTIDSRTGEAVFTADGLSGPAILAASGLVARSLPNVKLTIDFFPNENVSNLDLRLRNIFSANSNSQIKNALTGFLPPKLIPVLLKLVKIAPETRVNQIVKTERQAVLKLFKTFDLDIQKVDGFDKAMVTTGGVDLKEVDPRAMRSKIISNLFLAGEVLDLDGPTGGFNLQACWSVGRLAGESAAKKD
ncbi:MAG: NAD(P)/FAD-dependent oxidoreductase [Patescibacteria group bacterium]